MDRDFYDQLRKTSVEVFGNHEEEEQKADDNPESEVKNEDEECPDTSDGEASDQPVVPEYECVLDVGGLKLTVSSEDEETLETACRSLTRFFKHYIKLE